MKKYLNNRNIYILIIILISGAIFYPLLSSDFIVYDDAINVYHNPYFQPITLKSLLHFWKFSYKGMYIPLTYTIWGIVSFFSNMNPMIFHAINLIIHIFNSLLLFFIFKRLFKKADNTIIFTSVLFFLVHPIQTESVAWITELKGVLSLFFTFLSIYFYIKYIETARTRKKNYNLLNPKNLFLELSTVIKSHFFDRDFKNFFDINNFIGFAKNNGFIFFIISSIFFIFSLLVKPSSIVLPIVLLIINYLIMDREIKLGFILWLLFIIPIMLALRQSQPVGIVQPQISFLKHIIVMLNSYVFYILKIFFPYPILIDYSINLRDIFQNSFYVLKSLIFLLSFGLIYFVCLKKRLYYIIAGLFIWILFILPVSGIVEFLYQNISTVANRYHYFASIGISIILIGLIRLIKKRIFIYSLMLVFIFLSILSFIYVRKWKNTEKLFTYEIQNCAESWTSYNIMAGIYLSKNNRLKAKNFLDRAYFINPNSATINLSLGKYYLSENKDMARKFFISAIELSKMNDEPYIELANSFSDIKNKEIYLKKALERNNRNWLTYYLLGELYENTGALKLAYNNYKKSLFWRPNNSIIANRIGIISLRLGKIVKAEKYFKEAVQIDHKFFEAYYNLGNIYLDRDQLYDAFRAYSFALDIKKDDAELCNNIGIMFAKMGKNKEAYFYFKRAIKLKPNYKEAKVNLNRVTTIMQKMK